MNVRTYTHAAETLSRTLTSPSLQVSPESISGQLPDFFCSTRLNFMSLLPKDAIQNGKADEILGASPDEMKEF